MKKMFKKYYKYTLSLALKGLTHLKKGDWQRFFSTKHLTKKHLTIFFAATFPLYIWIASGFFLFDPTGEKKVALLAAETAICTDKLTAEEKAIYTNLGPIYQKIYLLALSPEEKTRVGVYVRRGQTPYEAIDTILRTEERKYLRSHPKKTYQSPAERATAKSTKSATVF